MYIKNIPLRAVQILRGMRDYFDVIILNTLELSWGQTTNKNSINIQYSAKKITAFTKKTVINMVAGAGFEPTTFGL